VLYKNTDYKLVQYFAFAMVAGDFKIY